MGGEGGPARPPRLVRHARGQPHFLKGSAATLAVVDQLVCAQAAVFVGTKTSLFSATIVEERELAGKPFDSSSKQFGDQD